MPYRYESIETKKIIDNKSNNKGEIYYQNNVYPDVPINEEDSYIITTLGDRLDLIAYDFYGDPTYWWVIASANSLPGDSMIPPIGMQLRIPYEIIRTVNQYKLFNANR
jgi:hypothetical protein